MITKEELEEFKKLYKLEYGIHLDDRTALYKAEKLMVLIKAVYKPIPKDSPYLERQEKNYAKSKT